MEPQKNKTRSASAIVQLDKPRLMLLNFNAMSVLHDATGLTLEDAFQFRLPEEERKPPSMLFMRDLAWAALLTGTKKVNNLVRKQDVASLMEYGFSKDAIDALVKEKISMPLDADEVGELIDAYGASEVFDKLAQALKAANEDPQAPESTESPLEPAAVKAGP